MEHPDAESKFNWNCGILQDNELWDKYILYYALG